METGDDPDDEGLDVNFEDGTSKASTSKHKDSAADKSRRVRHTSDVFIAEGAYTDCEDILKKFLSLKTSTFEDFLNLWKERKFSCLFNGRETYAELLEFTEEVLTIAKSFILPPHSKVKRIGALYLMYGLYTQQPVRNLVKYRVTPQEWSVILKFVESLKIHGFIDANYIFHKMCLDGAFLTVAQTREYGLERNYRKYQMPWPARDGELHTSSTFSLETLMGRVYRGSLKAAADKCLSKYNNIKQLLTATSESNFEGVKGTETELETVLQANIEDVIDPADLGGTRKFSSIGVGRKALKQKAFEQPFQLRGAQSSLPGPSEASTSQDTAQSNAGNESEEEDRLSAGTSESDNSEFQLMVKPPSRRVKRRLAVQKLEKIKKGKEKGEQKACSLGSGKTKSPTHKTSPNKPSAAKDRSRRSSKPRTDKHKMNKKTSEMLQEEEAMGPDNALIEIDEDRHDAEVHQSHEESVYSHPKNLAPSSSRSHLRKTKRSNTQKKRKVESDDSIEETPHRNPVKRSQSRRKSKAAPTSKKRKPNKKNN